MDVALGTCGLGVWWGAEVRSETRREGMIWGLWGCLVGLRIL